MKGKQKPRKRRMLNLFKIAQLVSWLDGYRVYRCVDPKLVEMAVKDSGSSRVMRVWKEIRHDIEKVAFLPARIEKFKRKIVVISALKEATIILFTVIVALYFPAAIFGWKFLVLPKFPLILIAVIILTNIDLWADYILRSKLRGMINDYAGKFKRKRERIKNAVQQLIYILAENIKKCGENPSEYTIKTLHADYNGIVVVSKPGYWSEYYWIAPDVGIEVKKPSLARRIIREVKTKIFKR